MAVVEYISISFGKRDKDILEWLKKKSKEKGIPISTLIKQILREYIKVEILKRELREEFEYLRNKLGHEEFEYLCSKLGLKS